MRKLCGNLALSASGKLVSTIGGPSVYPPQPAGVYAFTQKKKNWPTSQGPDRFRRTMYTFFYRSSPHPMLTAFDAPRFNVTCTRRGRSNTPLQSLMVANDPGLFELAEALADRVVSDERRRGNAIEVHVSSCFMPISICSGTRILTDVLDGPEKKVHCRYGQFGNEGGAVCVGRSCTCIDESR